MKPGLTYQWSVVGTDGGDFAFTAEADTRSGELSFAANPDYERPADSVGNNVYDITVNARDSDGETGSINVTVTVRDVNEPPTISGKTEVSLNEVVNPTTGQVVRVDTYTKSDPDRPSQTTNWGPLGSTTVLSGANAEVFDFDLPTGALTFKRPPDYENGGGTYQVTLTANDGAAAGTLDVTVTVANVEETGTLTLGAGLGVNGEALVATLEDPDVVATQTLGVAAQDGHVGRLDGHREHRLQQLHARRRRRRQLPARARHVHGRGRYGGDDPDRGHRVPDVERRLDEPTSDPARSAPPGRGRPGGRPRREERRASGVH